MTNVYVEDVNRIVVVERDAVNVSITMPGPQGTSGVNGTNGTNGTDGADGASEWGQLGGTLSDQSDLQAALNAKSNRGQKVLNVGPSREYTTIQSALTAIGNAANLADNLTPCTVIVDGGIYDENLIIPNGRLVTLLANGTVVLGDGLGTAMSSTNTRNITWAPSTADLFSGNPPRPALVISCLGNSDSTSTYVAQAGSWNISGNIVINSVSATHNLILHSVKVNGTITKTGTSLTNVVAKQSYFVGVVTLAGAIFERIVECQFDALVSIEGYNSIVRSEIKAGMTVVSAQDTMPPSGMIGVTFTGTFTGPASSLKLDSVSNYFFVANGASLAGGATKVIQEYITVAEVSGAASTSDLTLKVDKVTGKGLSTEDYTTTEKTKLSGIASGATANSSDATLLARANHTGTQVAATISDFVATVIASVLTGLSLASSAVISASDTVLSALGKLQAQITLRELKLVTTTQTASYTLALADAGTHVRMNNASANNLTVPPNSSVAFPVDTEILFSQYGAGQTTAVAGSGVTLRYATGLKTSAQYAMGGMIKLATDEWLVFGDLTA